MTGHDNGRITLNVAEADPATRERVRTEMDEPYRTLLGHFRHESGHYYWQVLVEHGRHLDRFRQLFGDERADYGEALAAYHANGPKPDWEKNYISAYATAHPWEDWAESWAHYLHMVDALETANDYALEARMPNQRWSAKAWFGSNDPSAASSAQKLIDRWVPLALAMNNLNRSMGLSRFLPFRGAARRRGEARFHPSAGETETPLKLTLAKAPNPAYILCMGSELVQSGQPLAATRRTSRASMKKPGGRPIRASSRIFILRRSSPIAALPGGSGP